MVKRLNKANQSQKTEARELRREIRKKDKEIAALKWENSKRKKAITLLRKKSDKDLKTIARLEEELRIAKLPKDSSNSSRPPSTDLYKPVRNKNCSLRKKSGKKTGGQPGHKGTTLAFCHDEPDEIITHSPTVCSGCGGDLSQIKGQLDQTHQVVDSTVPKRILINHRSIMKKCTCGQCNKGSFPPGAKGVVNYGPGIRALVANLSVRQYVSFARIVEFFSDTLKIQISEGTIANLLKQFTDNGMIRYNEIHDQVMKATVIGADETSVKVSGKKWWMHTYQTDQLTFIGAHPSRGQVAQECFFPGGFPDSILVTDCLAMQLSTPAAGHQVCNAHLLRELKLMRQSHPEISWPEQMSILLMDALRLHGKDPTPNKITRIENRLTKLLEQDMSNAPGKISAFWKRLVKHKEKVFLFLKYSDVPPDNNASERAIRNVKVKAKVSGQFRSGTGTMQYAVIRSIIDTANKQGLNIHQELLRIASLRKP